MKVKSISPEEILICETQGRFIVQVAARDADAVVAAARKKVKHVQVIGEITADDKEVFVYGDKPVAVIPNRPSKAVLAALRKM